jgi:DNA (cytosine-5)-methyltransferase 1
MEVINELALFAGAGGGILGGHLLGWRTVCAVEWNTYAASVLVARQNDGCLAPFPVWDDVQTFDGKPWRGIVDVVSGGFPCQDISAAGKGAGIDGEKSGMWRHMARIVDEVRPRFVFVENSPMLTSRGLGRVLGDLATMGYNAKWGVLGAIDAGAPHQRDRIWIVATDASGKQLRAKQKPGEECQRAALLGDDGEEESLADANGARRKGYRDSPKRRQEEHAVSSLPSWWEVEPSVGRVDHGVAARVDRLKALGNGQVSAVAELAWETLTR